MFEMKQKKVTFKQFLELFLSMLDSGLKIPVVLKSLKTDESTCYYAKEILNYMEKNVSFSHALCSVSSSINQYENMLEIAEETGDVIPILKNIVSELSEKEDNKKSFLVISIYPILVTIIALCLSLILYFLGVPYISQIAKISQEDLNFGILKANLWLVISIIIFIFYMKEKLNKEKFQYTFFRNLFYLVLNSVSIEKSLQLMMNTNEFSVKDKKIIINILDGIRNGEELCLICKKQNRFDIFCNSWLLVAKNNGDIAGSFNKVFEHYKQKKNLNKEIVMRLMEPAVFLISGVYILILIIYCVVPIFLNLGSNILQF